ncbi:MAG: DUF3362 domain-containing protein, partial [Oscillospiraceae bacterium]|nr:DUF3362 domain-containing protein [Oscillospiraceae bacterium]
EKQRQRALLQYFKPENRRIVIEALEEIGRTDLIGTGPNCLVAPDRAYTEKHRNDMKKTPAKGRGPSRRPAAKRGRR